MANKFGIPAEVKEEIRKRDKRCVYCHIRLHAYTKKGLGGKATLEHLNFDWPFKWKDGLKKQDLAMCCNICNSSRGKRKLFVWFQKEYCKKNEIGKTY